MTFTGDIGAPDIRPDVGIGMVGKGFLPTFSLNSQSVLNFEGVPETGTGFLVIESGEGGELEAMVADDPI